MILKEIYKAKTRTYLPQKAMFGSKLFCSYMCWLLSTIWTFSASTFPQLKDIPPIQ